MHFLQIWMQPNAHNIDPSYEEKRFSVDDKRGRLRVIISPDGADGFLLIHQDAKIYAGLFDSDESTALTVETGRRIYVHLERGALTVNGTTLSASDALKITDSTELKLERGDNARSAGVRSTA